MLLSARSRWLLLALLAIAVLAFAGSAAAANERSLGYTCVLHVPFLPHQCDRDAMSELRIRYRAPSGATRRPRSTVPPDARARESKHDAR